MMKYIFCTCCSCFLWLMVNAQDNAILGKWESAQKNLIVLVYKQGNTFQAKVVWFHDPNDTTAIDKWLDLKNPDKSLRGRKILGLDVLSGLEFNAKENRWINGKIYDTTSGRTWDATVWLNGPDNLNVRGYYIVRLFGKTMNFFRVPG